MNTCQICKRPFIPDKFHPKQKVCNRKECQRERKRRYFATWRRNNPDYFKNRPKGIRREEENKYRKKNKKAYNRYMKHYMRRYRNLKKDRQR